MASEMMILKGLIPVIANLEGIETTGIRALRCLPINIDSTNGCSPHFYSY
jgi:hypothetical protein